MQLIGFCILYDNGIGIGAGEALPDVMETPPSLPGLLRQDIFLRF